MFQRGGRAGPSADQSSMSPRGSEVYVSLVRVVRTVGRPTWEFGDPPRDRN